MSVADCLTKLNEARDALHALNTGQMEAEIWRNDRKVKYSQVNRTDLETYVRTLEAQCGGANGAADPAKMRRPFRVVL